MRYFKLIVLVLFAFSKIQAQENERLIPGDRLPDMTIYNILNGQFEGEEFKLLSGKYLVLDFGSTTCAPCIASLQKFQSLMPKYGDKLQVISVTGDKKTRVEKFLQSNSIAKELTIPVMYEDSVLHNLFPHLSTPHLVWIDKSGVIVGFTNHEYVTEKHIHSFLNNDKLNWPVKWDFPLDISKPLRVWNNHVVSAELLPKNELSVLISGYIRGLQSKYSSVYDSITGITRVLAINQSIPELYLRTMGRSLKLHFMGCQIITENFEGRNLVRNYLHRSKLEWMQDNTFSCEMNFPSKVTQSKINEKNRAFLDLYFSYKTNLLDTLREVWLISRSPDVVKPTTKKDINGISMKVMIAKMNEVPNTSPTFYVPCTDDVVVPFVMDIDMLRLHDFDYLRKQLNYYGYQIKKDKRLIESLIISKELN